MSTAASSTPATIKKDLQSLSKSRLVEIAEGRGLEVSGLTKPQLVELLAAHTKMTPTHVRVRANYPYHNGAIPERAGVDWRRKEERVIPLSSWRQITRDVNDEDHFTLIEKVMVLDD